MRETPLWTKCDGDRVTFGFLRYLRAKTALNPHSPCKQGRRRSPPLSRGRLLLRDGEVPAAVLLPAGFVGFGSERLLLAVADGINPARADAARGQSVLDRIGAPVSQSQVVLGGSALITV